MKSRVLIVCSGGGHWVQMKRLLPAFDGLIVSVATVELSCLRSCDFTFNSEIQIPDFNRKNPRSIGAFFFRAVSILFSLKPTHVVSTGAAPGLVMLFVARLMGCKVLWIDSIANAKKLSMSGRIACYFASAVFTQWEHLDGKHGARYVGRVI